MVWKYTFKTAISNIRTHKSRSALTILGIVIGVTSIILIVAIGSGVEELIAGEINSLGADIIWIEPGQEPEGPTDFAGALFTKTLKDKDIEALKNKNNVPGLLDIAPAVVVPGGVSYGGETFRPIISGWSAEFFVDVFKIYPEYGTYFGELEIRNRERVAMIGAKVAEELYAESQEAIGKPIKIGGQNFKVTGVLPDKGQIFFYDIGNFVIIPYTTAQTYILGGDHYNEVWVKAESVEAVPLVVQDIEKTLRERHNITDPDKDDFYILTQDNLLDQVGSILDILTIAIGSIVAIALIVGGVGVMNIMFVSVTERTREIGLRKAVGATAKDITFQFLTEAVILTFVGGVIGVLLGGIFAYLAVFVFSSYVGISWNLAFPYSAAILGFIVSAGVGLIFGYYPARQAAQKSPIEALRYE